MTLSKTTQAYLRSIYEKNGRSITPATVLAEAKRASSPLHKYFEWDDRKAAHLYRLTQAREMIGLCVIVESGAREYVYVPSRESFIAVTDAVESALVWREVVEEIERSIGFALASAERTIAMGPLKVQKSFERLKTTSAKSIEQLKRAAA